MRALELASQIRDPVDHDDPPPEDPMPSSTPFAPPEAPDPAVPPDKFDPDANMRRLMHKMGAGRASEGELRQLRALCANQGNRACRNQANAALKAKRRQDP